MGRQEEAWSTKCVACMRRTADATASMAPTRWREQQRSSAAGSANSLARRSSIILVPSMPRFTLDAQYKALQNSNEATHLIWRHSRPGRTDSFNPTVLLDFESTF